MIARPKRCNATSCHVIRRHVMAYPTQAARDRRRGVTQSYAPAYDFMRWCMSSSCNRRRCSARAKTRRSRRRSWSTRCAPCSKKPTCVICHHMSPYDRSRRRSWSTRRAPRSKKPTCASRAATVVLSLCTQHGVLRSKKRRRRHARRPVRRRRPVSPSSFLLRRPSFGVRRSASFSSWHLSFGVRRLASFSSSSVVRRPSFGVRRSASFSSSSVVRRPSFAVRRSDPPPPPPPARCRPRDDDTVFCMTNGVASQARISELKKDAYELRSSVMSLRRTTVTRYTHYMMPLLAQARALKRDIIAPHDSYTTLRYSTVRYSAVH